MCSSRCAVIFESSATSTVVENYVCQTAVVPQMVTSLRSMHSPLEHPLTMVSASLSTAGHRSWEQSDWPLNNCQRCRSWSIPFTAAPLAKSLSDTCIGIWVTPIWEHYRLTPRLVLHQRDRIPQPLLGSVQLNPALVAQCMF